MGELTAIMLYLTQKHGPDTLGARSPSTRSMRTTWGQPFRRQSGHKVTR